LCAGATQQIGQSPAFFLHISMHRILMDYWRFAWKRTIRIAYERGII